ncbi:MAG: hypothetical protein ABR517_06435 [Thermoanaerobaculia bacterium]
MIPLRDRNPRTSTPWVNYTLIALNLAAFAWELSLGVRFEGTLASVAFVPERMVGPHRGIPGRNRTRVRPGR